MQQQADSFVVQSLGMLSRSVSCPCVNTVEGFFATLTKRRLNRGVFHSMSRFLKEHNMQPRPLVCIADPIKISPPCAERIKC